MRRTRWSWISLVTIGLLSPVSPMATGLGQQPSGGNYSTQQYQKGAPARQPAGQPGLQSTVQPTAPAAMPAAGQPGRQAIPMQGNQPAPAGQIQAGQPVMGMPAMVPGGRVNPVAPFPPPDAQWQAYLEQVLDAWEKKSSQVTDFECNFKRFQYDPALVQEDAYTLAAGVVKYMKPDKGLFRVDQLVFHAGRDGEAKPKYQANPRLEFGEFWICDGEFVDIRDRNKKESNKYQLPPNMRGAGIVMSPLPFLFGVKASEIKERYWVRALPQSTQAEVWLEAYPKRLDDAANYHHVKVVLDLKDFMPRGLIAYMPNWRPDADFREIYEFENRKINANGSLVNRINPFQKEFFPGDPPKDWKVVIEPFQAAPPEGQVAPAAPSSQPRVAGQPAPAQSR